MPSQSMWSDARGAAVVAAGVEVGQPVAGEPDRGRRVLLLDVHVEGVEQDPDAGRVDAVDDLQRLLDGVEEARLEAVERLDARAVTPRSPHSRQPSRSPSTRRRSTCRALRGVQEPGPPTGE